MDGHTHTDEESDFAPPIESASYAGAFFPNSQHLVVEGGTFTSNIITGSPSGILLILCVFPNRRAVVDYLRIPFGSIDLRHEIFLDGAAGLVSRNHKRGTLHRMYSARINRRSKPMTVALYQGDGAEQKWRESIFLHSNFRHPHVLQLYATASLSGIYATIFHDDLIPFKQFLASFRHSAILQAYIHAYTFQDELEAYQHCRPEPGLHARKGWVALWIRLSTGRLCAEFGGIAQPLWRDIRCEIRALRPPKNTQELHDPNQESWVIASPGFYQLYPLFRDCLTQYRYSNDISVQAKPKLNSIMRWPSGCQFEDATEIAWVPRPVRELKRWNYESLGMLREDGSVRYNSGDAFGKTFATDEDHPSVVSWLCQANYVFSQLEIISNYEDYVFVDRVRFSLYISAPEQSPPDGYLFLCPPMDFETGPVPAYWSLHPCGGMPLTVEEATSLGFPPIKLSTRVYGMFWDGNVYRGLHKFNVEKGFDPDIQDVACALGYPLYEISVPDVNESRKTSSPMSSLRMILWKPLKSLLTVTTLLRDILQSRNWWK
ncbi:hypothetical protein C8R45DRAFT_1224458 [Mycena sanguinolenta]|nr:hypothetical protein C8R45DRAFT_1224458 [Mycena sanguinolenta]